ncbi:MAG: tetratricopeptide repeat protein [Phycisphaeraceae bacterium]|nr:tetratricopeptide repeat protein [Phycisphaeraceae bacterium]
MASNVNKKFVVLLAVGTLVLVGLSALLLSFGIPSAREHAQAGDALMAKGEAVKAADRYAKAVSKESNNVEYIGKWIKAMSSITPVGRQEYTDRFRELVGAMNRVAEVKRTDLSAHRAILDPTLADLRRGGGSDQVAAGLMQQVERSMKLMPAGDKNADGLRRYRGLARVALLSGGQRLSDEELAQAREDLEAALAFDQSDEMSAAGLTDYLRLMSLRARTGNDPEGAATLLGEARAKIDAFIERQPGSAVARAAQLNVRLAELAASGPGISGAEVSAAVGPLVEGLLASIEQADPAKVDLPTVLLAADAALGARVPDAVARATVVLDKVVAARPGEPMAQYLRASFLHGSQQYRQAADAFGKLAEMPNLPVGFNGMVLWGLRDSAAVRRVDALLGVWEQAKEPAQRQTLLAEVKAAREGVRARASVDELAKLLMDGKVALAENDLAGARKLLAQYNQRVPTVNTDALLLLARVLERQGLQGEARQCYQKIIDARRANLLTYVQKAALEIELKNYKVAYNDLQSALAFAPDNEAIKKQIQSVVAVMGDARGALPGAEQVADPLTRLWAEAENLANQTPPDFAGAAEKLKEARPLVSEARQYMVMARMLLNFNNIPEALATVAEGVAKFPDDASLAELKKALESTDPVADAKARIEASSLSAAGKEIELSRLYARAGKQDLAAEHMDKAEALDKDNPVVIGTRFEQALAKKDVGKAQELAGRAKVLDLDKAGGKVYAARVLQLEGKPGEGALLVQQAAEADPANPGLHRLLGQLYLGMGDLPKALASLERALQIQPRDPQTLALSMRVLLAMGRATVALERGREALRFGISEPEFVQLWLTLEYEVGDKARAVQGRQEIFARNPQDVENAFALATILVQEQKAELAEPVVASLEGNLDRALGDALFGAGDFAKSLEAYGRARASVKEDREGLLVKRMIECNLRLERLEESEKLLAGLDVDKTADVQVMLLGAEVAQQRGDKARARALLDRAVAAERNAELPLIRRADTNMADAKLLEDALADYEAALRINPQSTRARLMLAECYLRKGDAQQALGQLQSGLRLDPLNADWRSAEVQLLLNTSRGGEALASLNEMMGKTTDPRWAQMAGSIYMAAGDAGSAVKMFGRAWEGGRDPASGKGLVDALLALKPMDLQGARKVVDAPEFKAATDPVSRLSRARVSMLENKPAQAAEDVRGVLGMVDLTVVRNGFVLMEELRRVWESPQELLSAVESLQPEGGWTEPMRVQLAMQRLRLPGEKARGLAEFEELAKSSSKEIAVLSASVLGTTYFNDGDAARSVAAYQRGLVLDANNKELLNNMAYVMSKGLKQHAEALPLAQRAVEQDPANPSLIDTLGAIRLELGRVEEAGADFERARSLTADALVQTMPTVHLIEVRLRQGKVAEADVLLKELEEGERRDPRVRQSYQAEIDRVRELRKQAR